MSGDEKRVAYLRVRVDLRADEEDRADVVDEEDREVLDKLEVPADACEGSAWDSGATSY
jgi:hypothetical protein